MRSSSKRFIVVPIVLLLIFCGIFARERLLSALYFSGEVHAKGAPDNAPAFHVTSYNLREIGQFSNGGEVVGVFLSGDLAFLADESDGLEIVNILDPATPTFVGSYQVGAASVFDVVVQGKYAFLAHGEEGLRIVDISSPTGNFTEVGFFNDGGTAWSIALSGNYAFVADRAEGLEILDISNVANPVKIGQYAGEPFDVFLKDDLAFVAAGWQKGLEIVDISIPSAPKKIGEVNAPDGGDAVGVFVQGEHAFLACRNAGLQIITISDPDNPKEIARYKDPGFGKTWDVFVDDTFAFIADDSEGIEVLDISNPYAPQEVGQYYDGGEGQSFQLTVSEQLIFVADFKDGLEIIGWKGAPPAPVSGAFIPISSGRLNFNYTVDSLEAATTLGDENNGLDLAIALEAGLELPINITVAAPEEISPGDLINLKIRIMGERSIFWICLSGTIQFRTFLGSSDPMTLADAGVPTCLELAAIQTVIGRNITDDTTIPIKIWEQELFNTSVAFWMVPIFNITGTATISARINGTGSYLPLDWTTDGEQILVPVQIPADARHEYSLPIEELQFNIADLRIDMYGIRFDLIAGGILLINSWLVTLDDFAPPSTTVMKQPSIKTPFGLVEQLASSPPLISSLLAPNQENNRTLVYLDGVYPLGDFIIVIKFTGNNLDLPPWALVLILGGIIILIFLPWIIIFVALNWHGKKREKDDS